MPIIKRTKYKLSNTKTLIKIEEPEIIEATLENAEIEVQQRLANGYTLKYQNAKAKILTKHVPPIELQIGVFY